MIISEVKNDKKLTLEYPYLGVNDRGDIILFTAPMIGIWLRGIGWQIGEHAVNWAEMDFTPFTGELVLRNG